MNNLLKLLLSTLLLINTMVLVSCEDDAKGNYTPFLLGDFSFTIKVVDNNSKNLLLDENTRNKIAENITITYNGKTYPCDYIIDFREDSPNLPESYFGMYMSFFECIENKNASSADITFGPFLSWKYYNNETFTINWGDGSSDIVEFTHGSYYTSDNIRVEKKEFYLNDEEIHSPTIIIKKSI